MPQNDGGNDHLPQKQKQRKPKGQLVFEGNVSFKFVQNDGPPPTTIGFDDDDDEDDEEDDNENEDNDMQQKQQKKVNGKEENDDDEEEEKKENENKNKEVSTNKVKPVDIDEIDNAADREYVAIPHIVNGRDLNGPLCSEDDDTDEGEDLDPADKIICQFTRVVRKKNEWNVDLKHGLMHINGKDYAFQKATGGSFAWK